MKQKFGVSFNTFMKIVMTPILAGPRWCCVVVAADRLDVKMGMGSWAFSASVQRSSVAGVKRVKRPVLGWGAHGWRGHWLINGSSRGLVQLTIDPPVRGRCLIVPIKVKQLTLSLAEPDEFIAALS